MPVETLEFLRARMDALKDVKSRWPAFGVVQLEVPDDPSQCHWLECDGQEPRAHAGVAARADCVLTLSSGALRSLREGKADVVSLLRTEAATSRGDDDRLAGIFDLFAADAIPALRTLQRIDDASRAKPRAVSPRIVSRSPSWEEIQAALDGDAPTVFHGALNDVPDSLKSLEGLNRDFGTSGVLANTGPARLTDLIALIQASSPLDASLPRSGQFGTFPLPAKLKAFLALHWTAVPAERVAYAELFLSAKGVTTRLHRDVPGGVIGQFFGRKRWVLFPPRDSEFLSPQFILAGGFQHCEVDVAAPDLKRFPAFASAVAMEVMTEPGDLLVLPSSWFHHVETQEHSLGIRLNVPLP